MGYKDPEQQRAYQREWMARRRATWFEGKSCTKCGSAKQLELDHIDPKIKITHAIWSWATARREAELAKCQVLCKLCHAAKTYDAQRQKDHGTSTMYLNGCRCRPCKDHHAWRAREYRMLKDG